MCELLLQNDADDQALTTTDVQNQGLRRGHAGGQG